MTTSAQLDRVIAWPISDREQRVHLAESTSWRIIGAALCGQSIKREATDDDKGDECAMCKLVAETRTW
jgi:hypothetical protein